MPDDFQTAVDRARARLGETVWRAMSSQDQTIEIYVELRALDAERTGRSGAQEPVSGGAPRS